VQVAHWTAQLVLTRQSHHFPGQSHRLLAVQDTSALGLRRLSVWLYQGGGAASHLYPSCPRATIRSYCLKMLCVTSCCCGPGPGPGCNALAAAPRAPAFFPPAASVAAEFSAADAEYAAAGAESAAAAAAVASLSKPEILPAAAFSPCYVCGKAYRQGSRWAICQRTDDGAEGSPSPPCNCTWSCAAAQPEDSQQPKIVVQCQTQQAVHMPGCKQCSKQNSTVPQDFDRVCMQ